MLRALRARHPTTVEWMAESASMTDPRHRLGRAAEALVADWLERMGWRIVARNARTSTVRGELDLIAIDGGALVFLEVKALSPTSAAGPERPAMAVGHRKRHKLRTLALAWLGDHDGSVPPHRTLRFDVVGVRVDSEGRVVEREHLPAAF
jgi:putative endonuclease